MAGAIAVGVGAWAHLRLERFSAASLLLPTMAIPTGTPTEAILTLPTPGTTAAIRTAGTALRLLLLKNDIGVASGSGRESTSLPVCVPRRDHQPGSVPRLGANSLRKAMARSASTEGVGSVRLGGTSGGGPSLQWLPLGGLACPCSVWRLDSLRLLPRLEQAPAPRPPRELEKLRTTSAARLQRPPCRTARPSFQSSSLVSWVTVSKPSSFRLADHGAFERPFPDKQSVASTGSSFGNLSPWGVKNDPASSIATNAGSSATDEAPLVCCLSPACEVRSIPRRLAHCRRYPCRKNMTQLCSDQRKSPDPTIGA